MKVPPGGDVKKTGHWVAVQEIKPWLSLAGKEDVEVTKTQTLSISRIASACEESLKEGKPIELPL